MAEEFQSRIVNVLLVSMFLIVSSLFHAGTSFAQCYCEGCVTCTEFHQGSLNICTGERPLSMSSDCFVEPGGAMNPVKCREICPEYACDEICAEYGECLQHTMECFSSHALLY